MSYQTGAASDQDDILDKLRTFLVANGWSSNKWEADGDGYRLHLQKGSQYVNFRSTETNPAGTEDSGGHIWICGSDGFDGDEAWNAQPNSSEPSLLRDVPIAASYHFFQDGDCCYVVAEPTVGIFRHMAFGIMARVGLAALGHFVGTVYIPPGASVITGTNITLLFDSTEGGAAYRNWFRLDIDGYTGLWVRNTYTTSINPRVVGTGRNRGIAWGLLTAQPNTFNQAAVLIPLYAMAYRGDDLYSLIGYAPNLAICNIANYLAGDEIVIGADTWMIFPLQQRAVAPSLYYAYAYKKVT